MLRCIFNLQEAPNGQKSFRESIYQSGVTVGNFALYNHYREVNPIRLLPQSPRQTHLFRMFCFIQDRIDIRVDNIGESRKYAHLLLPLVDFLRILSWHNYSNIRANSRNYLNLLFLFIFYFVCGRKNVFPDSRIKILVFQFSHFLL